MLLRPTAGLLFLAVAAALPAQAPSVAHALPLRQSALDASARDHNFQYALDPKPIAVGNQADDPWWRVSRHGKRVEPVERLLLSRADVLLP